MARFERFRLENYCWGGAMAFVDDFLMALDPKP